jgi:two-component system sensor histidine kinase UhpB
MRHARATTVHVKLAPDGQGGLRLCIHDDGVGMDTAAATRGLGLLGAAERAAALGGELQVQGSPGHGVRLVLQIPLPTSACVAAPGRAAAAAERELA